MRLCCISLEQKQKIIIELTIIDILIDINCLKFILGVRLPNTYGTRNPSSPYHWLKW